MLGRIQAVFEEATFFGSINSQYYSNKMHIVDNDIYELLLLLKDLFEFLKKLKGNVGQRFLSTIFTN